jgi:hypothetical protein
MRFGSATAEAHLDQQSHGWTLKLDYIYFGSHHSKFFTAHQILVASQQFPENGVVKVLCCQSKSIHRFYASDSSLLLCFSPPIAASLSLRFPNRIKVCDQSFMTYQEVQARSDLNVP